MPKADAETRAGTGIKALAETGACLEAGAKAKVGAKIPKSRLRTG